MLLRGLNREGGGGGDGFGVLNDDLCRKWK